MTSRERFHAVMNFKKPDTPFIWTFPIRPATMNEWLKQGYPGNILTEDLLGYDYFYNLPILFTHFPEFEKIIIGKKDGHITYYDEEGALRIDSIADQGSGFVTRKWLKFPVESRDDFIKMKERYNAFDMGRRIKGEYEDFVINSHKSEKPTWLTIFGLYWTLRQWMGFEGLSIAFYDSPKLITEMLDFVTEFNINLLKTHVINTKVDVLMIDEDMAYKTASMVSPKFVAEEFVPRYKEIVKVAKEVGIDYVMVDCDGHISELIELWQKAGIVGTSPLEMASEQDILDYGKKHSDFIFFGGIDKRILTSTKENIKKEVDRLYPLYERGGWVPAVDHAVPSDVPFENFKFLIDCLKEYK